MNHVKSRFSPQMGACAGPRTSMRSCSSRMYCCSFFQFSSRLREDVLHEGVQIGLCDETASDIDQADGRQARPPAAAKRLVLTRILRGRLAKYQTNGTRG